jgi:hypothetical protein
MFPNRSHEPLLDPSLAVFGFRFPGRKKKQQQQDGNAMLLFFSSKQESINKVSETQGVILQ